MYQRSTQVEILLGYLTRYKAETEQRSTQVEILLGYLTPGSSISLATIYTSRNSSRLLNQIIQIYLVTSTQVEILLGYLTMPFWFLSLIYTSRNSSRLLNLVGTVVEYDDLHK